MTSSPSRLPWSARLVAEGIVVVASILIAFALDAWWDRSVEARALAEALEGVRVELTSNRDLLVREMGTLDRISSAGGTLLDRMEAESTRPSIAVTDTLAFLVTNWAPSLEVSLGAVDALIASGRLAEIGDSELRLGLAGLRDRFADIVEDELVGRQIHVEQLSPLLGGAMDLRVLERADSEFFSGVDVAVTAVPHYGDIEFPNSRPLRNVIWQKVAWYGSARGEITRLIRHLDHLLALTESERA